MVKGVLVDMTSDKKLVCFEDTFIPVEKLDEFIKELCTLRDQLAQ